jgi:hypothetical protein
MSRVSLDAVEMLLGTRVQFPPPPLFLYKRQQATVSVKTRLTFLMAVGLRRTRTGVIFAKERQQTDKAFLIAKPMRKAAWTKRFAAGWGERRRAKWDRGGGEAG